MSAAARWLTPSVRRVHIVGIGGKGVSAIAHALVDLGYGLSGSDLKASAYTADLETRGAMIHIGHASANVGAADLVIRSAAVPDSNPELVAAAERGIPIASRADAIADLFNSRRGIAVAGTHGKTTTSGITATIFREAGLDPSYLIGASVPSLGGRNGHMSHSRWMVIEADEFDRAFLAYEPQIAVLTHLEPDHLDYFGTVQQMQEAFSTFVRKLPADGDLVARGDIRMIRDVTSECAAEITWFGPGEAWDVAGYQPGPTGVVLDLRTPMGPAVIHTSLHGLHNAWNLTAAIAAATRAGIDLTEAAQAASAYTGADRRMVVRAQANGITVIEDYAHHPTAARETIAAASELPHRTLWAIYQPLLLSRTRDLFDQFLDAFGAADRVILAEIYSPPGREAPIAISSAELARAIRHPDVRYLETFAAIEAAVRRDIQPGDLLLVMGPESVTPLADRLAALVQARAA